VAIYARGENPEAMTVLSSSDDQAHVVIAGGGVAAVEAALALRALADEHVRLTLVSPDPVLLYRPAATVEAFDGAPPLAYDLRAIAEDLGVAYHQARLKSVGSRMRYVRTGVGARLEYDALILALGARAVAGVPGAMTFRDQRDVRLVTRLLREVGAGAVRRVAFALPPGCSRPLPLYELAFLLAKHAQEHRLQIDVSIVSPEPEPLALFGPKAARLVADMLATRGVRFVGDTAATEVRRDGTLALASGARIPIDRVVAVPELRGRQVTGVPADPRGFVPTDASGRVAGVPDIYAAGDMTTFPIKQGGLATQQADRIAHTIAEGLGASVKGFRTAHVLQARLLSGDRPVVLRTELDWNGQPTTASLEHTETHQAASSAKVFAQYLAPYLETLTPLTDNELAVTYA
jgi:sulfide:quinone oxidoreductase